MPTIKIQNFSAFTLIELMISISIIAILTAAAIPSFTSFSNSQTLNQNVKTLKSDLRIAQSRSISGSTVGGNAKAWGIYFDTGSSGQYTIIACAPAVNLSQYAGYTYTGTQCPTGTSIVKTVRLGSQVKLSGITKDSASVNPMSLVFDAQNGAAYANGSVPTSSVVITLSYTDGSSPLPVTITAGGGISD